MEVSWSRGGLLAFLRGELESVEWGADHIAYATIGALFLAVGAWHFARSAFVSIPTWHVLASGSAPALTLAMTAEGALDNGTKWPLLAVCGASAVALVPSLERDRYLAFTHRRADRGADARRSAALPLVLDARLDRATGTQLAALAYGEPQLRTAIGALPNTPASVLAWLAAQSDPEVTAAIAQRAPSASR